ncbi:hypothetical protein [Candidatus Colwellia aromaticivorans]|uniref:hypothetical protein n=1 Tax=Candidatus Colwellia aromaticivorans TaxID=2267621 RepID=UPI000DF45546|nr:hypothetical protein [Candidatus Colwellia aromaticivorans]
MTITYVEKTKKIEETSIYIKLKTQVAGLTPEKGEVFDDVLVLKDITSYSFNFGWFDLSAYRAETHYFIIVDGQQFSIKTSMLAWIIWCDVVGDIKSNKVKKVVFQGLLLLFGFLTQEKIDTVNAQSLTTLLEVMLTCSANEKGISKRIGVNGARLFWAFNPPKIEMICKLLGMKNVLIHAMSKKRLTSALNKVLMSVADISYTDYAEGGSFNFLTLDIGKHYINHLNILFSQHFFAAYAVAQVKNQSSELISGYEDTRINHSLVWISILETHSTEQTRMINKQKKAFTTFKKRAMVAYEKHYKDAVKQFAIFSDTALDILLERLGLTSNEDNKLFIKSLLSIDVSLSNISEQQIIDDFSDTLEYLVNGANLTLNNFKIEKNKLIDELVKQTVIVKPDTNISSIFMFDTTIGRYGFTNIMALLGWRESEYTFPETAINISRNHDVVDQIRYPVRFQVKWKVPKMGGETKIYREISLNSYILLKQLQTLHCSDETQPILFKSDEDSQSVDIRNRANVACVTGWRHFNDNYVPFVELDMLEKLQEKRAKGVLDISERTTLLVLSERYSSSSNTQQVCNVRRKVRDDLSKLIAVGVITESKRCTGAFLIESYCNNTMSIENRLVWDEQLLLEHKEYLASLEPGEKIDRGSLNDILNTIKSNCAYPTPHAFRHIWAECVYRRYSGDVGWLIRTNFKHFGEQFYRRYLREKHMQTSEEIAKRRVISSILTAHLNAMKFDERRDFGGKMDVFLRRVFKQTKVVSPEQYGQALMEFANLEIADIKANPWGFCMLKMRNRHRANCAEDGVPQRDKAGVEFCIGCTNHLVEQENIVFIVLNVANHVTALKQPMPLVFKIESQRIVTETIKMMKQLDKNNKTNRNVSYIEEMQSAIDISKKWNY